MDGDGLMFHDAMLGCCIPLIHAPVPVEIKSPTFPLIFIEVDPEICPYPGTHSSVPSKSDLHKVEVLLNVILDLIGPPLLGMKGNI